MTSDMKMVKYHLSFYADLAIGKESNVYTFRVSHTSDGKTYTDTLLTLDSDIYFVGIGFSYRDGYGMVKNNTAMISVVRDDVTIDESVINRASNASSPTNAGKLKAKAGDKINFIWIPSWDGQMNSIDVYLVTI